MPPYSGIHKYGERGSGFRPRGEVQDYAKIKERCLEKGILFEDPQFKCRDSSIFYSQRPSQSFEWKRPSELCDNPQFFVEGVSRFDVKQGKLGDCWLLAAVANLTLNSNLFHRVVPEDQSFEEDYAGIFHFRFWQYGKWIDVVVDDRLPTYNDELVFMHSEENNEFWSALLEKAYAKLHGSYESLKGGVTSEAMEDFTGGLTEMFELKDAPPNLFNIMQKAHERMSLMGCAIEPDPDNPELIMPTGLVAGHAYSVTDIKKVEISTPRITGLIPLLRIRNPWGNQQEWNGAWSDQSPEWTLLSDDEKEELGLTFSADGEFWMSFKDFMINFMKLDICNLHPDSLEEELCGELSPKKWETCFFEGTWTKNCTAGGCRNYLDTFAMNPQYRVVLEDVDEDDDEELCTMIVALMQKNRRSQRKKGAETLTIGYSIYHLKDPSSLPKPLPKEFFKYNKAVVVGTYVNLREVSARFKLEPGTYCIIPSTFEPNEEAEYVLRIFTEKKNETSEYDEDTEVVEPDEENQSKKDPWSRQKHVQIQEDDDAVVENVDRVKQCFSKIAGEDGEVDCYELKEILNLALRQEFEFEGFCLDVCRSMVAMVDADMSGKLGLEEFRKLWLDILLWKLKYQIYFQNVFKKYDFDDSSSLNTIELRAALQSAGYRINLGLLRILALRYGRSGKITFDDFIMCIVKLKTMIETFREKDKDGNGRVSFSMEEWLKITMYS